MPTATTSELLVTLDALRAEMELYVKTGMRVSPGRLVVWVCEVRLALAAVKES